MYWARQPNALFLTADFGYKSKYIKQQNRPFWGKMELSFTDTKQDRSSCVISFAFSTEKHLQKWSFTLSRDSKWQGFWQLFCL